MKKNKEPLKLVQPDGTVSLTLSEREALSSISQRLHSLEITASEIMKEVHKRLGLDASVNTVWNRATGFVSVVKAGITPGAPG